MGIDLVKQVVTLHGDLPGSAYKVLVYMAATALDKPNSHGQPAGLYFGGWEPLAIALGSTSTKAKTRDELVRRALKILIDKALIKPLISNVHTGEGQAYRLKLSTQKIVENPVKTIEESPANSAGGSPAKTAGQEPRQNSGKSPAKTAGPRTHTGQKGGLNGGHTHSPTQPSCLCGDNRRTVEGECLSCGVISNVVALRASDADVPRSQP